MNVLKLQNQFSWLQSDEEDIKRLLWEKLRFREKNYFHSAAYRQKKWDGYRDYFKLETGRFLTGLLPEVQLALKFKGREYTVQDERKPFPWAITDIDNQFLNQWVKPGGREITLHDYQVEYIQQAARLHRGLIVAPTGCHRAGQKVLMFDGSLKRVEMVAVGDKLMGPDSKPRTVLSLCRGKGQMYRIVPTKGKPFVVNEDHILTLAKTSEKKNDAASGKLVDVAVKDWLKWSKWKKHIYKLTRASVEFSLRSNVPIDPYFLGVLLGDGSITMTPGVTTHDPEIVSIVKRQAKSFGLNVSVRQNLKKTCPTYVLSGTKYYENPLTHLLRKLGLWGKKSKDKFVPHEYKTASRLVRQQILAGLLDTDGSLNKGSFDFISKSKSLASDVAFLSRSLGFYSLVTRCRKTCQTGKTGIYFRATICGDVHKIPCQLPRKQATARKQIKNVLRTGFFVQKLGIEEFYGFMLDGDHRYLLDDFTITHNSGKSFMMVGALKCLPPNCPTLVMTKSMDLTRQIYDDIQAFGFEKLGRVYGGKKPKFEPNIITVANIDSVHKMEKLLPHIRAVLVDEVHLMMSSVPKNVYQKLKNAYVRLGLSATPFKFGGTDKCQRYETKGFFGPVIRPRGGKLSTKELQERGILSPSKCVFYPINEPELPYETYQDATTLGLAESLHFNETIARLAKKIGGRTLIIVERVKQGEMLQQLIPGSKWVYGKDDEAARDEAKAVLQRGDKAVAIVQQKLISAGINVFIHNMINAMGGKADHDIIQRMGRGLRKANDKEILHFYDFVFNINDYLLDHSLHRIKVLKGEGHELIVKDEVDF